MKIVSLIFLGLFISAFSSISTAETPNEAASEIHALLASKSYETLFKTRYSEWYKVEKESMEEDEAVKKLSQVFEQQHSLLLSVYEQLKNAEYTISKNDNPQPSENGRVAQATITLQSKALPFKLYQMKNDKWGFHL